MRHAGVLGCGIGMVGAAVLMTAECATLFALGGCETELPGMVYQVRLSAPPEVEECVKLGEAISTATDVTAAQPYYQEFRPWSSRKTCLLTLTGRNESGPCQISVSTSTTNPIIALSVTVIFRRNGAGIFRHIEASDAGIPVGSSLSVLRSVGNGLRGSSSAG